MNVNKKNYCRPYTEVVDCETEDMLAGSITGEGGDFGWGAKGHGTVWDDEWEDDGDYPSQPSSLWDE